MPWFMYGSFILCAKWYRHKSREEPNITESTKYNENKRVVEKLDMILMTTEEDIYDDVINKIHMNAFMILYAKWKVAEKN